MIPEVESAFEKESFKSAIIVGIEVPSSLAQELLRADNSRMYV